MDKFSAIIADSCLGFALAVLPVTPIFALLLYV
jgi:hypothetical protein